jgi:hypothetical protein
MSAAAIPRPTAMRPRIFMTRAIPSSRVTILPKAGAGATSMRYFLISATMSHHRMGLSRGIIKDGLRGRHIARENLLRAVSLSRRNSIGCPPNTSRRKYSSSSGSPASSRIIDQQRASRRCRTILLDTRPRRRCRPLQTLTTVCAVVELTDRGRLAMFAPTWPASARSNCVPATSSNLL